MGRMADWYEEQERRKHDAETKRKTDDASDLV
jgi:hypothetical protein